MTTLEGTIDYTLEQELGSGAFGVTYLAKGSDENKYAIKKFKKEGDEELQIEQGALSIITSICNQYATCFVESLKVGTDTYMVIDYIEGVDLAKIIFGPRKEGLQRDYTKKLLKLEERKEVNIIDNLVSGLKMLHDYGLIHQDIKPENLMYTPDGNIKFIDFGLACIANRAEDIGYPIFGLSINKPCGSVGSIITAPPEMFLWDAQSIRSYNFKPLLDGGIFPLSYLLAHDVWSLCCVIMAWYTLKDGQNETFTAYNISLNKTMFQELDDERKYNIIVSLFDRDVQSRLDNFNSIANGVIPISEPNWNDTGVTLRMREELRQWRCYSKNIANYDYGEDCNYIPKSKPVRKVEIILDDYAY
jgi:serine/threonine protein kinase